MFAMFGDTPPACNKESGISLVFNEIAIKKVLNVQNYGMKVFNFCSFQVCVYYFSIPAIICIDKRDSGCKISSLYFSKCSQF